MREGGHLGHRVRMILSLASTRDGEYGNPDYRHAAAGTYDVGSDVNDWAPGLDQATAVTATALTHAQTEPYWNLS